MSEEIERLQKEFDAARADTRKRQEALEKAKWEAERQRREKFKDLASFAHETFCPYNHTDGCSWGYEESAKDPWSCDAHVRWLTHVDRLINGSYGTPPVVTEAGFRETVKAISALRTTTPQAMHLLRNGRMTP